MTKEPGSKLVESHQLEETATPDFEVTKQAENKDDDVAEASVSEFKLACSASRSQAQPIEEQSIHENIVEASQGDAGMSLPVQEQSIEEQVDIEEDINL